MNKHKSDNKTFESGDFESNTDKSGFDNNLNSAEDDNAALKKKRHNNIYFLWGLTGFLTVVACMFFYFVINNTTKISALIAQFNSIMMPVFCALIIAYLLTPVLNFIEKSWVIPLFKKTKKGDISKSFKSIRGLSIFLTMLFTLAIVIGIMFLMISQIAPSIGKLVEDFDMYVSNFQLWVKNKLSSNPGLMNFIIDFSGNSSEQIEGWLTGNIWSSISKFVPYFTENGAIEWAQVQKILGTILGGVGKALSGLWNFVIGLIIAVYLMAGKEKFVARSKKLTYSLFSRKTSNALIKDVRFAHKTFIGFFGGKIIDSLIIGILCFIGTTIMQTPYAALVSIFVGVTNIIPYFGPFIGAIPSALLVFLVDPMHPLKLILFVIFILILQQIDGNIIGPKILGDSTGLEGFWVIFSITVFGGLLGIPGMIIGVPLFAIIYAGLRALVNMKLEKKNLSQTTSDYIKTVSIDDEGIMHEPDYEEERSHKQAKKKESSIVKMFKKIGKKHSKK